VIYTHLAAFLAGSIIAGSAAWKTQQWRHDAAQLAAIEQARETEVMRRKAANAGAAQHEREKIVIRKQFVPVVQEVERVVTQVEYRDRQCFGADVVRIVNQAVGATGLAGKPGDAVPGAGTSD
jgi:hypothetical protein